MQLSVVKAFADYPHGKSPEVRWSSHVVADACCSVPAPKRRSESSNRCSAPTFPVVGFYGYGEIGPPESSDSVSRFHNETFVSLILGT